VRDGRQNRSGPMTPDQRIALSVVAVIAILGGGIFLAVSASSGGTEKADCTSGEVEGIPIREGQHPDQRACEAMDFVARFVQSSPEECGEFVSADLLLDCKHRSAEAFAEWTYIGDNGVDPSFPDVVSLELGYEDGYVSVDVEQVGDTQRIVDFE
jgi:hypothetical protein